MNRIVAFTVITACLAGLLCVNASAVEYKMTYLATLGGSASYASDINENGQVVGFGYTPTGALHACYWDKSGNVRDLGSLYGNSYAEGINNQGIVVGMSLHFFGNMCTGSMGYKQQHYKSSCYDRNVWLWSGNQ